MTQPMSENSGAQWVARFPTSRDLADLAEPFRTKATKFVHAMQAAGMVVSIAATYRPRERAYLMHYAWEIARNGLSLAAVPALHGVDIIWNWSGGRGAAEAMVQAYGIAYEPAVRSRHTDRLAVDMGITWNGHPTILKANGERGTILTSPRDGSNTDLQHIGAMYGVYKLESDLPHWSSDGH
jgi:hypothetical protein